tara:strand:- start:566 stop:781 length:216 start_codon:yes stop_codon:yes gene_type:complete
LIDHLIPTDVYHLVDGSIDGDIIEDVGSGRIAMIDHETVGRGGKREVDSGHVVFVVLYGEYNKDRFKVCIM